jgi:hypothetical protein
MLVDKIRRARKAAVSTLGGLTTLVVLLAPDAGDEYKAIVGAVGVLFTGLLTYLAPNKSA